MKITKVNVHMLQKTLETSMCISRGGFKVRNHAIIEIETDQGITGLGEGIGNAAYIQGIIEAKMGELSIGLDPRNIEDVRRALLDNQVYFERMGSAICAASAIEMACWDIKAKALNVPLYELLGGLSRDKIEAYASNIYWEEDISAMTQCAEDILSKGIKSVKAHIGFKDAKTDLKRVAALRETIGPDINLMIDLNAGYTFTEALKACELWGKYNLFWLEEPLSPYKSSRLPELKSHTDIPIALGENEFRTYGFKDLFEAGAVDVAMPDIGRVGGIWEAKLVCEMAESFGVQVSPHNYSSGVLLAATLHLMAATPYSNLLEYDASDNSIYHEFFPEPLAFVDGKLPVPQRPGLGVELTDQILEKYKV
ncbi:MAG: mandelate racemase/muconate lactonizing enzyme family protein [Deltaproteobacteria bacterium]|nr:mandelate racemase/muconate lactonizing enzyme family protein [Deltaproteobacteria bacterium]